VINNNSHKPYQAPKLTMLTSPTTHQANKASQALLGVIILSAAATNWDGKGEATELMVGPRAVFVGVASTTSEVCDGKGGRVVADVGAGRAIVAERALKLDCASAVLAAYTLTVVVVVTVLEVAVLRERLSM
jgi:hypothetical protein